MNTQSNRLSRKLTGTAVRRQVIIAATFLCMLPLLCSANTAKASSIDDCIAVIRALELATDFADFTGRNAIKDKTGLIGKLEAAIDGLDQFKSGDAIKKMTDYRDKALTLAAQGKLDPTVAQNLAAAAADVIACIRAITS